jgi:hypothetical protein
MANVFAQYAPRGTQPFQPLAPTPAAPASTAAPVGDNPFAGMATPQTQEQYAEPEMETWWTTVRGKRVQFQAPKGANKVAVRAAAKQAGVSDAANRSLQFGKPPEGPTQEQKDMALGPVTGAVERGVDFVAPVVDELAAGATAAGLNPWRRPDPNKSFGDNYTNFMRQSEDVSNATDLVHPTATRVGRIGAFVGSLPVAAQAKFLQGANWLNTSLRMGVAGGVYGGANAYANNSVDDRWNGVPLAAGIGTGIGLVTPAAANIVGEVANRVNERLGLSDMFRRYVMRQPAEQSAEKAAVDVIAARVPQNPAEMRVRAQEMRDVGHEPTLTNVVDESGRGLIAAMARKSGPGREAAQRAYDARRLSAPERIDRNMAAAIEADAGDPAVAAQLKRPLDKTVADLKEQRSAEMQAAMDPIRGEPVPLNPRMFEILNTADGQRAISQAMRTVTDKPTLDAMRSLQSMIRSSGKLIDPRLPPAVQEKVMAELAGKSGMTVDIADRLARKFNAMADTAPADAQRALRGFATELRDHARTTVPKYDEALKKYSTTSKSLDAVDTGSDFMTPNAADDFATRAGKLDNTNPTVKEAQPRTTSSKFNITGKTTDAQGTVHKFEYTTPQGDVIKGRIAPEPGNPTSAALDIDPKPGSGVSFEQWVGSNRAGPQVVRDLGRHIANAFPDLKTVGGYRVSGARRAAGVDMDANVNLDRFRTERKLPSDRQYAQQAARRAVQQRAGENISAAPGVARKIAVSPEQSIRTNALFSPLTADKLERAMGVTERDLRDFAQIAPNTGSATAIRSQDDTTAVQALATMAYLKSGNVAQAALHALRTIGIRDKDAATIVHMAIDPARTDELINHLEKSYDKQTAQKIGRILGLTTAQQTGRNIGGSR